MFIDDKNNSRVKRYSLVNNDPSYKSYTQNQSVYDQQQAHEEVQHQSVLTVSLKDAEENSKVTFRAIKKDLLFVVKFSNISSSRYLGTKETTCERTFNDFCRLGQAL